MYKLFTDKSEDFVCDVQIKNASLKGSIARLMIETSNGPTLAFNGTLVGDKCIIPIKRLKGLLDENDTGNIHLEIIVEDTFFKPWSDKFIVEENTSVKVQVAEQTRSSSKPIVEVKSPTVSAPLIKETSIKPKPTPIDINVAKKEIALTCEQFGIKKNNFKKKRSTLLEIVKEYFNNNPKYNNYKKPILSSIASVLR